MWQQIKKIFGKANGQSDDGPKRRVLVIEDGEVDRRVIVKALEKNGYQVYKAIDGNSGIETALKEHPDLIILDYGLPDIDGKTVCQRLKREDDTQDIPVIFLTAKDSPSNVVDCYEVGAEYFLAKPITSGGLLKQLDLTFSELSRRS